MFGFLMILWLIGTIGSIYFIVKPKKEWPPYATRWRAFGMAVACFLGFPILGSIVDPQPTSGIEASADTATADKAPEKTPEEIEAEKTAETLKQVRRRPGDFVTFDAQSATTTGFGTIMEVTGTFKNSSPIDLKDPVLECELFAESGTRIDTVRETVFKVIPANGSVRVTSENLGFAHSEWRSYSCRVVRASLIEEG